MNNLFRVEFLRHRNLAAGFALLQFVVLYYLYTLGTTIHTMPAFVMWTLVQAALGGAFGLFQIALHKRSNDWVYLLHRPLSPHRIFAALILAGAAVCLLAVLVSALLILVIMQSNGINGIEAREYLLLPFVGIATLCAYLCACFAQLGSSRLSFLALFAVPSAMLSYVTMTPKILLMFVLVAWALYLAWSAFAADPKRLPRKPLVWLLTELPIQYGCLWLIVTVLVTVQELNATVKGIDTILNPVAGSDLEVRRMPIPDRIQFALQGATHPDAAFLRQQVPLGEFMEAGNVADTGPDQGVLPLTYGNERMVDVEHDVTWTFSYDAMLFAGYANADATFAGWLGPAGFHADAAPPPTRFSEAPWATGEFILDSHNIYLVDWENRLLHHRHRNAGADRFNDSFTVAENLTTLFSDSRLYVFRTAELRDPEVELQARAIVDIPVTDDAHALRFGAQRLGVLELIDGYLVVGLSGLAPATIAPDFAVFGHARLDLYRTREGAGNDLIASVPLSSNYSDALIYREFVAAPGMRLLTDAFWGLALGKSAERTWPLFFLTFPAYIYLLAALVSAVSAGLTAWLLRGSHLPKSTKIFWIAGNAFTGLAGLLSFVLGYYWRRKDQLLIDRGTSR
jgi:hypothetical protein